MAYLDKSEGSEALVKFEYGDKLQQRPTIWQRQRWRDEDTQAALAESQRRREKANRMAGMYAPGAEGRRQFYPGVAEPKP